MFNNWIFNNLKLISILFIIFVFNSCKKDCKDTEYYNFTNDELSYILIENNEITMKPIDIYKIDTVKYLLNSTDTLKAKRIRSLGQTLFSLNQCPKYMIEGVYSLNFLDSDIIDKAYIYQNKDDSYCGNKINRELFINSINDDNHFKSLIFETSCYETTADYLIDTTKYNNIIYSSYKFKLSSNYTSSIRDVVFIKNIGFVRFIDENTNKLELIQ